MNSIRTKAGILVIAILSIALAMAAGFLRSSSAEDITGLAKGTQILDSEGFPRAAHPVAASNGCLLLVLSGDRGAALLCLSPEGAILWQSPIDSNNGRILRVEEQANHQVLVRVQWGDVFFQQTLRYSLTDGSLLGKSEVQPMLTQEQATDEDLFFHTYPAGNHHLMVEIHDKSATCEPMYFRLEDEYGTALWQVAEGDVGIWPIACVYPVETGTLLLGLHKAPTALLVDAAGEVLWRKTIEDVHHGIFLDVKPMPDGTVAVLASYIPDAVDLNWGGYLLLGLDPASGDTLWEYRWEQEQNRPMRMDLLLPLENGFLIASENNASTGGAYLWLDAQGNELAYWESRQPGDLVFYSDLFAWQNRYWALPSIQWQARQTWESRFEEVHFPW